ncbi:TolC family protein (plasmid) [Paraburkholderia acidicola]|uniref:Protein CyaE n=1 Tax=Paraburkholderia acidicola TaxID=1912599 RepID=A0ABV1LY59_9BURK
MACATALSIPCCWADTPLPDVFGTASNVLAVTAIPLLGGGACHALPETRPLELDEVILQAICANPVARRAWADARAQAAALGVADAAYLPTLNATVGVERNTNSTTYDGSALGESSTRESQKSRGRSAMLEASWVLFDFGRRSAIRQQALALLAAANASHDEALQTAFFTAAQAFYALREAQASLDAAQRTEVIAHTSLAEAEAKHDAGAGTLADELQARTSYRRAVLDRVGADGDMQAATGALAVAIGLDANAPVRIAFADSGTDSPYDVEAGIDQLIDEARRRHPKLAAARAQLDAARANVEAVRGLGYPTVSLVGSLWQNNPKYQQPDPASITRSRGSTIGLQVTIPLFEGFASGYRVRQAEAQVDAQGAVLRDIELQLSLDVWKGYQGVQTCTANLANSRALLDDGQRALDVARARYKQGVGTLADLLAAQAALADAQKQRVLAVSKWQTARLKLATSLGKLNLWRE